MAKTDRAFRALARASPRSILALVRLLRPELIAVEDEHVVALDDPHVDLPPYPREADFAATVGDDVLLHVEGQGYRDPGFVDRNFRYGVTFSLRHPERTVRSVGLWLHPPEAEQRVERIRRGSVSIEVETVVLREAPATLLLSRPETACFAAGADASGMDDDALCDAVVAALGRAGAPLAERALAAVAAMTMGRYAALVRAMERAEMEPVIIEDLVDYGFDLGRAKGREEGLHAGERVGREAGERVGREAGERVGREAGERLGREAGRLVEARAAVLTVLGARGFVVDERVTTRVQACKDVGILEEWLRRAVVATSVDGVFER